MDHNKLVHVSVGIDRFMYDITGITQCQNYKGCLVTTAMDSLLKVWDTSGNKPSCLLEKKFKDQVCLLLICLWILLASRND